MIKLTDEQYKQILQALSEKGQVTIRNFGKFIVHEKEDVPYYNIITGLHESGKRVHISFTPTRKMKEEITN